MLLKDFDYELPEELIAQFPSEKRELSNMMVLNRAEQTIDDKKFFNITDYLSEKDVLVLNNTRVIPARLLGHKSTGAKIEIFLLKRINETDWETLIKPSKRVKSDSLVEFSEEFSATVVERLDNDKWHVRFNFQGDFFENINRIGIIPLPPYIMRTLSDEDVKKLDHERYQTVYAQSPGSVAAPTAGLHFTPEIIEKLKEKGVTICTVNLNVGLGTFRPVKAENILEHKMDREYYEIPEETAQIINNAKKEGKNIVAVGTTSVRTLESAFIKDGEIKATSGWSELFIYPGFKFKVVDKLLTNFHLPKSTLLMLISALAGREFILKAYQEAIEKKYRFYSYGDCMLII